MDRLLLDELRKWKDKKDRKPLILRGARQVGKTWLLKDFGAKCFKDVCYVNFEQKDLLGKIFEGTLSPQRIIGQLSVYHGKKIAPQETLLIFDEVQELPRALTSLKYFAEEASEYAICCAGSLLGVALHQGTSFPVGKVDFLVSDGMEVYPLECKAGVTMNAKSLKSYKEKYAPSWCLRSSLLPYEKNREAGMVNIPLYMLFALDKELADA